MTVRDALQNVYSRMQAHHAAAAADDQGHADDCATLAACMKAAGHKDAAKAHSSMEKRFANSAARHQSDSEVYGEMAKTVGSTMTKAFDPDAIVPDDVKTIYELAPRVGQPAAGGDKPVDPRFEKMVAIEE